MKVAYFALAYGNVKTLTLIFFLFVFQLILMKLSHKLIDVLTGVSTLTQLWGHRYLVHLPCGDLSHFSIFFFLFSFFSAHKKHKNANKQISDFSPSQMFFKRIFYFCSLSVLCFCLVASLCFCAFVLLVLLVHAKSFCKKKKK